MYFKTVRFANWCFLKQMYFKTVIRYINIFVNKCNSKTVKYVSCFFLNAELLYVIQADIPIDKSILKQLYVM